MTQAYISRFRDQVLPIFDDASSQADMARDEFLDLALPHCLDEADYETAQESALSHGMKVYVDTNFVRSFIIGLSLSGIYHLWERQVKRFIAAEFYKDGTKPAKAISKWDFKDIIDVLADFGFDVRGEQLYHRLSRLRVVANTVKHGDGPSRDELSRELPDVCSPSGDRVSLIGLRTDGPSFDLSHFDELSQVVLDFWCKFPERLFLAVP